MRRSGIIWGAILLLAGLLLLLENLGLLPFPNISVWQLLVPLAFIGVGVWILLGSRFQDGGTTTTLDLPLEQATEAEIRVDYGAGELRIDGGSSALADGTFEGGVEHEVRHHDGRALLRLRSPSPVTWVWPWSWGPGMRRRWHLRLTERIPMSLSVHSGASDCHLDLERLKVTRLRIESGASSLNVILPARAGHTEVRVSTGAASLSMRVPEGVAARIRVDSALSSTDVDRSRFPREGGVYRSPGYDSAANRLDIKIDTGVGSISVR
jgi:hypothetical protein